MNDGKKYDGEKPRWDLLPWLAMNEVVKVLTMGAKKYGDDNWKMLENLDDRYLSASMRHEFAYQMGDRIDEESGLHPLAHKICSDLFRLQNDMENK
jgi:hypothetical protein